MSAHAFSTTTGICPARHLRAARMRDWHVPAAANANNGFHNGMLADSSADCRQTLAKGELFALPAHDFTLLCEDGELWLTRAGDLDDHILGPGQRFAVRQGERAVVQALKPSRFSLSSY